MADAPAPTALAVGRRLGESGVTLVELAVVLSLIGILAAIGYANLRGVMPRYRLEAAVRDVSEGLVLARMRAISANREYRFVPDVAADSFGVDEGNQSDNATAWTRKAAGGGAGHWPGIDLYRADNLVDGAVRFNTDGSADPFDNRAYDFIYLDGGPQAGQRCVGVRTVDGRVWVGRPSAADCEPDRGVRK
jgi:prepilin-type N-terminal cleavage/methylation domain-containing protein